MSLHVRTVTRTFLAVILPTCTALSLAADGTIRIRGAVVEPACSVSTITLGFDSDAVQRLRQDRASTSPPLAINMQCNAAQRIQLTLGQATNETRAEFETGVHGVRVRLHRDGRVVAPGAGMSVSLPARAMQQIRMETQLVAGHAPGMKNDETRAASQADDPGRMLIAIDYM